MKHIFELGRATRPFLFAVSLVCFALAGCGDDGGGGSSTGGSGGSEGNFTACGICVDTTPIGPNVSDETCAAFGALFDCETSTIQGECPGQRLCVVTNCTGDPDCNALLP